MKLAIGLLLSNGFPVPAPFVLGLLDLTSALVSGRFNPSVPPAVRVTDMRIISCQGFPVDTARNDVCRTALADPDVDALLFLDADMRHPADLAHRLLRHGQPLVTARYQMRKPPFHTCAFRKGGPGPHDFRAIEDQTGLVPVDRAGAGALLIVRDVLEAVRDRNGEDWFRYQEGPNGLRTVSEDMWFFESAIACGYQPWCDLDTVCTHVAAFEVDPGWQQPYLEARDRQRAEVNEPRLITFPPSEVLQ